MTNIALLLNSKKTVFTVEDGKYLFSNQNDYYIRTVFNRYKKQGILLQPKNGVWVLSDYNTFELANKLKKNSYNGYF